MAHSNPYMQHSTCNVRSIPVWQGRGTLSSLEALVEELSQDGDTYWVLSTSDSTYDEEFILKVMGRLTDKKPRLVTLMGKKLHDAGFRGAALARGVHFWFC